MKKTNKSDLSLSLGRKVSVLDDEMVARGVCIILNEMVGALARGRRIEIRGFGSFCLHHHAPRMGRNPKTGLPVFVAAKAIPHFKAGKTLKEAVNFGLSDD